MDGTIQRNFSISKSTVDKLNRLNVWGRMGPSELTDVAIRLLYEVCKSVQQDTGMDAQAILHRLCSYLDPGIYDSGSSLIGQQEPQVSPELSDFISTLFEVAKMLNPNASTTLTERLQKPVETAEGGESP